MEPETQPMPRPRARLAATLGVFAALFSCLPPQVDSAPAPDLDVETMVGGLDNPVAFDFAPDGRIFIGERTTGRIRVVEGGVLLEEPFARVNVSSSGERGLLGLALAPDFAESGQVYVFHSRTAHEQRITRFTARGNLGTDEKIILESIPAANLHNGGCLGFGPDGFLYFTVGDTGNPSLARDPHRFPGKLHRIALDGGIPDSNPWPRSTAFCLGVRNSFGFTFRPHATPVAIYLTDNGTAVDDEVNLVRAGADLGWPEVLGVANQPRFVDPIYSWSPTTAPVGIVYYWGENYPLDHNGDLFVGEYETGAILRIPLDLDGRRDGEVETFLRGDFGRLYALELGPDGALWFSTAEAIHRVVHPSPPTRFIRGNVDGVNGINYADTQRLLAHLLEGAPLECRAAADINDDERIDLTDFSALVYFVSGAIPRLPPPFPQCGIDHTTTLGCDEERHCP